MSLTTNYLLVPITVEALVVGEADRDGRWATAPMDYTRWAHLLDPDPGPVVSAVGQQEGPEGGVHLHWALPDALAHGFQAKKGEVRFPCIPNRWLVVRLAPASAEEPDRLEAQAWVVESDYLNEKDGSNSFPDPDRPGQATRIGRSVEAGVWTELGGKAPWLTATGPSDATFTAFYPNVRNVLGFHDTINQLKNSEGRLSYLVFGWYSDASGDPLSPKDAESRRRFVEHSAWSLDSRPLMDFYAGARGENIVPPDDAAAPERILCHGFIHSVPWQGYDGQGYVTTPPDSIGIAVGNTAAEAVAALVASRLGEAPGVARGGHEVARLLEALQYQLLTRPVEQDGPHDRVIHAARFAPHPGGWYWQVTKKEPDQASAPDGGVAEPALTPDQQESLGKLNVAQRRLDALKRRCASLQCELYALWWKYRFDQGPYGRPDRFPQRQYRSAIDSVKRDMAALGEKIVQASKDLKAIKGDSKSKLDPLQLERKPMPDFWQANDPVVLVEGAGRFYKHGEDGRYSDTGELPCRRVKDAISAIDLLSDYSPGIVQHCSVTGFNVKLDFPTAGPAGEAIRALAVEAFLLDPNNARTLAGIASGQGSPTAIAVQQAAKQQTLVWNAALHPGVFDPLMLQEQSGFNGVIPSPVGVQQWKSPWSPLYLDWIARWAPDYAWPPYGEPKEQLAGDAGTGASILSRALQSWRLTEGDYQYTPPPEPEPQPEPPPVVQFKGRVLVTPQVTLGLQTGLATLPPGDAQDVEAEEANAEAYLTAGSPTGSEVPLPDLLAAVKDWDVLSQALGSFGDLLTQRRFAFLPPAADLSDKDIAQLLGGRRNRAQPNRFKAIPQPAVPFFPMRAGRLLIDHLFVVDSFGHATYLEHANALPVRHGSFIPPDSTVDDGISLYLPPRLSQPARLMLRMMSPDDTHDTLAFPAANPICGWLLPLWDEQAIAVFDAQGQALGHLLTIRGGSPPVRWERAPGSGVIDPADPNHGIANVHLRRFVATLVQPGLDDGKAVENLVHVIDATLWAVDPEREKGDEALSVLIGRPLALVRAQLQLELEGSPLYDLQWPATASRGETRGWTSVSFPVRLGDLERGSDGLIGFVCDPKPGTEAYSNFYAVYDKISTQYIRADNSVSVQPQFWDMGDKPSSGDFKLPPGKMLTLLLDPRGGIDVVSGILPALHVTLPARHVQGALAAMQVTFGAGPILDDGIKVRMPLPIQSRGTWSWIHPPDITREDQVEKVDDRAHLADAPLRIVEGWLKLAGKLGEG